MPKVICVCGALVNETRLDSHMRTKTHKKKHMDMILMDKFVEIHKKGIIRGNTYSY